MFESLVIWAQSLSSMFVFGMLILGVTGCVVFFSQGMGGSILIGAVSVVATVVMSASLFARIAYAGAGFTAREFVGVRDGGRDNTVTLKGKGEGDSWVFIRQGVELARMRMKSSPSGYTFMVTQGLAKTNPMPVGAQFELMEAGVGTTAAGILACVNCGDFSTITHVPTPILWTRVDPNRD